jgi:predicted CXXCH cytochrome family protein
LIAVMAAIVSTEVVADIRMTPHSLSSRTAMLDAMASREVCVFCHTPTLDIADGELRRVAPVWQPAIPEDYRFTMYDDIGRAQYADKPVVGSQSIACLSCHDANQAFSVTNFSYDHPFGIPYRGFSRFRHDERSRLVRNGSAPSVEAKHLKALDDFREPSAALVDSRVVWWVSSTGNQALRSRGDLPLYARLDDLTGNEVPYIECTSCHDPHTSNPLFLRVTNERSRLCLTCHDK